MPRLLRGWQQPITGNSGVNALDLAVANNSFAFYDPSDITSIYQVSSGITPVAIDGDPIGLILDKKQMGGKTAAAFIAEQPQNLATGAPALTGSATAATYTTGTGVGSVTRVDASNQSSI